MIVVTRKRVAVTMATRLLLGVLGIVGACSCATMEPSELPPDELRRQIASGDAIRPGQTVAITTADGQRQELQIAALSDEYVAGSVAVVSAGTTINIDTLEPEQVVERVEIRIAIDQIVAVEIKELTPAGKAAGAAGAVAAVGAFWYFIWILPALIVGAAL